MLFAAMCHDKPDHLAVRTANRDAHLAWLKGLGERVRIAGPFLDAGIDELLLERRDEVQPILRGQGRAGAAEEVARAAFPGRAVGVADVAQAELFQRRPVGEVDAHGAARERGFPLIDQAPRPGLAGMICFLHPKGTAGVLVEFATPPAGEHAHHAHGHGPLAGLALREVTAQSKAARDAAATAG